MIEENSPDPTSPATSPAEALEASPPPTCDFAEDPLVSRLVRVLDEYLDDMKAGKAVSRAELLAAHPDLAERLESCLAGIDFLNPAPGEVIILRNLQDLSHAEIANRMNRSEGAVRMLWLRALEQLRKEITFSS